jgi:hypothetical protein
MTPIIRLNKEAQSLLTTLAENLGVSEQDALQIAVDRFISAHDAHAIAARTIDSLLVRDAALLERLGSE